MVKIRSSNALTRRTDEASTSRTAARFVSELVRDGFDPKSLPPEFLARKQYLERTRQLSPEQRHQLARLGNGSSPIIVSGFENLFQAPGPTDASSGTTAAQLRHVPTKETYVTAALTALEPWHPTADSGHLAPAPTVDPTQAATLRRAFTTLMWTHGYAVEEVRRLLLPDYPFVSRQYVDEVLAPALDEPPERFWSNSWGEERNFHFAQHLAFFLLSLPPGSSEESAVKQFRDANRLSVSEYAPHFSVDDLHRLQLLYPFVPRWDGGVKSDADFSLAWTRQPDHLSFADWTMFCVVRDRLTAGASIPLIDPVLRAASSLREANHWRLMSRAHLVEVTAIVADVIPRMHEHLRADGLAGSRMRFCGKHYSADPIVVDLLRRVFGAKVDVGTGDNEVDEWTRTNVREAAQIADGPIVVHIEGLLGVAEELAQLQRENPGLELIQISHSTSDARDAVRTMGDGAPHLVELMGLSEAKEADEQLRFRSTFAHLLLDLTKALGAPLAEYSYAVMGYGNIIGPSAAAALEGLGIANRLVVDPNPARREAALKKGHQAASSIDSLAGQAVVILSAAGKRTLGEAELSRFAGKNKPLVLVSLGSGQREFDMEWIKAQADLASTPSATNRKPLPRPRIIGYLGREPIWEYNLRVGQRTLQLIIPADGYPANLAQLHPTPSPYAATTPLLITEAMREGVFRRCVLRETGLRSLDSLELHVHHNQRGTAQRYVRLNNFIECEPDAKSRQSADTAEALMERYQNTSVIIEREPGWWNDAIGLPSYEEGRRLL